MIVTGPIGNPEFYPLHNPNTEFLSVVPFKSGCKLVLQSIETSLAFRIVSCLYNKQLKDNLENRTLDLPSGLGMTWGYQLDLNDYHTIYCGLP